VPKTAVHENDGAVFAKHDVRPARQPFAMEPKPKAHAMQH